MKTTSQQQPHAIVMMGLPASGKSTIRKQRVESGAWAQYDVIDADEIKIGLPGYDPENPAAVHAESKALAEATFEATIACSMHLVLDATGTNSEKLVSQVNQLHGAGYRVTLVYVATTLASSIARNQARQRHVPETVIREKAGLIATSFEIVSRYVDAIEVVNN